MADVKAQSLYKLKSCIECGNTQLIDVEIPESWTVDGIVYDGMLPVQECTACKENYALGLDLANFEDYIVEQLRKLEDPGPEAQKWMDKIIGNRMREARLARLQTLIAGE